MADGTTDLSLMILCLGNSCSEVRAGMKWVSGLAMSLCDEKMKVLVLEGRIAKDWCGNWMKEITTVM